jgi:hypothetical protein
LWFPGAKQAPDLPSQTKNNSFGSNGQLALLLSFIDNQNLWRACDLGTMWCRYVVVPLSVLEKCLSSLGMA